MKRLLLSLVPCLSASLAAQSPFPALDMTAGVSVQSPSSGLQYQVEGVPGRSFVLLFDRASGPIDVFGERLYLGLTPGLLVGPTGILNGQGQALATIRVGIRPGLAGVRLFAQAFVLDAAAQNGMFAATNGASAGFHATFQAIVDDFGDAASAGFTGNYDASVRTRLQGGAIRTRTHRTVDPSGVVFGQGITGPLHYDGAQVQIVYRPQDLGSTGEEERVTAVRWRAFGGRVFGDVYSNISVDLAHTDVTPNYLVDAFTALPTEPDSGLATSFAQNPRPGSTVRMYSGSYTLGPSSLRADGYVDYPISQGTFDHNGADSLLIDIGFDPTIRGLGANSQIGRLMVQSSALPAGRVVAQGTVGAPIIPAQQATGVGDNFMFDYQIEFTRVATTAVSPWRLGIAGANYQTPMIMAVTPPGTSIRFEYRGADDGLGANATAWSNTVDIADGHAFVQYRVRLEGNAATGEVPSVDSLVIPF